MPSSSKPQGNYTRPSCSAGPHSAIIEGSLEFCFRLQPSECAGTPKIERRTRINKTARTTYISQNVNDSRYFTIPIVLFMLRLFDCAPLMGLFHQSLEAACRTLAPSPLASVHRSRIPKPDACVGITHHNARLVRVYSNVWHSRPK